MMNRYGGTRRTSRRPSSRPIRWMETLVEVRHLERTTASVELRSNLTPSTRQLSRLADRGAELPDLETRILQFQGPRLIDRLLAHAPIFWQAIWESVRWVRV